MSSLKSENEKKLETTCRSILCIPPPIEGFPNINNYFDKFYQSIGISRSQIKNTLKKKDRHLFYKERMCIDNEQFKELNDATSVSLLTCEGEIEPFELKKQDPNHEFTYMLKLQTQGLVTANLKTLNKRLSIKQRLTTARLRYGSQFWMVPEEKSGAIAKPLKEIVFNVRVYYPFQSKPKSPLQIKLMQEIEILGFQFLIELKSAIKCFMDYTGTRDVSDNVDFTESDDLEPVNMLEYPSSFFFIEDTFYNDVRTREMKDLSEGIREWAVEKGLRQFKKSSTVEMMMKNLNFRLGHPYVFCHQGNCEHLFVISDVKFLGLQECQTIASYPYTISSSVTVSKKCAICNVMCARWLVVGNERLPQDWCYLCSRCFKSFNYIDGKKVGSFKAYRYVSPLAVL